MMVLSAKPGPSAEDAELQSSARCLLRFLVFFTGNSNRKNSKLELNGSISMCCAKPVVVISYFDWVIRKLYRVKEQILAYCNSQR
jgi:hypothetical protein